MCDVNVLVYAHRLESPQGDAYSRWLEELLSGPELVGLSTLVAPAFVRIVTNRRVFPDPTPLDHALAFVESMASRSNVRWVSPGPRHGELFAQLCRAARLTGGAVADAAHAAVAIEHDCEWVSADSDFAKFESSGLRWRLLRF